MMYGRSFAGCELAWTSFDESARIFKYPPRDDNRIHPTQKPIALYKWLLTKFATEGGGVYTRHPCWKRIKPNSLSRFRI